MASSEEEPHEEDDPQEKELDKSQDLRELEEAAKGVCFHRNPPKLRADRKIHREAFFYGSLGISKR
jgi:hypothetical protein